ncbi:MAG: hypothetical protein PWQ55_772 [Chloroflexota bacterium]|nr:hypothetical protein [Chloroflexota bacterium]
MSVKLIKKIVLLWLGWAVLLLAFQHWAVMRLDLSGPDRVLDWTAGETLPGSARSKYYLSEPFMNGQAAWDSEYYLSIATGGYDDPRVQAVAGDYGWQHEHFCTPGEDADCYSLNYAFFPLYPLAMRAFAAGLNLLPLGLSPVAAATLAGVSVSLLGTLGAMLGLCALLLPTLGEEGALRAAFFMLVFPSGFFLAQVYTEGLFLGLTFGALACLQERKWGWAALLAVLAVWTRPGGAILLLPFVIVWVQDRSWKMEWKQALLSGMAALSPALSYGVWTLTPLAERFHFVEDHYFGRGFLALRQSFEVWQQAFQAWSEGGNPQTVFYYSLEFGALLLALLGCFFLLRKQPALGWYGLAVLGFIITSGSAQGMLRYVLAVPGVFALLSHWGRSPIFDRLWTLLSVLLLGMEALLFTFNFWVA